MSTVCVIDADGIFVTSTERTAYTLRDGDQFIDAEPPTLRPYRGYPGFVKPIWDGESWREGATFYEILLWEARHPKA
jgi:hypothetical protein